MRRSTSAWGGNMGLKANFVFFVAICVFAVNGRASAVTAAQTLPVYLFQNPTYNTHALTTNDSGPAAFADFERFGWVSEGSFFQGMVNGLPNTMTVYQYYNGGANYAYSTSSSDATLKSQGFSLTGPAFNSLASNDTTGVTLTQLYRYHQSTNPWNYLLSAQTPAAASTYSSIKESASFGWVYVPNADPNLVLTPTLMTSSSTGLPVVSTLYYNPVLAPGFYPGKIEQWQLSNDQMSKPASCYKNGAVLSNCAGPNPSPSMFDTNYSSGNYSKWTGLNCASSGLQLGHTDNPSITPSIIQACLTTDAAGTHLNTGWYIEAGDTDPYPSTFDWALSSAGGGPSAVLEYGWSAVEWMEGVSAGGTVLKPWQHTASQLVLQANKVIVPYQGGVSLNGTTPVGHLHANVYVADLNQCNPSTGCNGGKGGGQFSIEVELFDPRTNLKDATLYDGNTGLAGVDALLNSTSRYVTYDGNDSSAPFFSTPSTIPHFMRARITRANLINMINDINAKYSTLCVSSSTWTCPTQLMPALDPDPDLYAVEGASMMQEMGEYSNTGGGQVYMGSSFQDFALFHFD